MNYGELKDLAQQFLENEEATFVANLPLFVRLMEEEVYRRVQLPELRKNSTSTFTTGSPYVQLPSDYKSAYSIAVVVDSEYAFLQNKDVNFIREAYPNASTTGVPRYYAQFDDDTLIVCPSAASNYTLEMHYYYAPATLADEDDDDNTTWLSENAENVVLYGTLMHGYIYMKGEQDVIQYYRSKFEDAMMELQRIAEGRQRKDTYRSPDKRVQT